LAAVFGAVTEVLPLKVYPASDGVIVYELAKSPVKVYCPFAPVTAGGIVVPPGPPLSVTVTPLSPAPASVIWPLIVHVPVAVKLTLPDWLEGRVIEDEPCAVNVAQEGIEGVTV